MNPGDKVITQHDMWCDSFGNDYTLARGERLTIAEIRNICGQRFLSFDGLPEDHFFWAVGFASLRNYN